MDGTEASPAGRDGAPPVRDASLPPPGELSTLDWQDRVRRSLAQAVWEADADGHIVSDSPSWRAYTGQSRAEWLGDGWLEAVHPEDRARAWKEWQSSVRDTVPLDTEFRLRHGDGYRWTNARAVPLVDDDGSVRRWLGMNVDIDDRKRAEAIAREREQQYRIIVESATDYAVMTSDALGKIDSWSPGAEAVFGWTAEEMIGRPIDWTYTPEDREAGVPAAERAQAAREGSAPDMRWHQRKDGTRVFIEGTARALFQADGAFRGVLKIGQDVTQRRRLDDALRASEARYRALVENIRDYAIFLLDPEGFVTEWTEGAARVTGYSAAEAVGAHLSTFYTPEDLAQGIVTGELEEAAQHGRAEREGWRVRKDGRRIWINEIATAVRDPEGRLTGYTKISRDLTDRRRAEEALRQSDRRKDEFLATLAHELRNPLAPLRNGLALLRRAVDDPRARGQVSEMMERQMSHLVRLIDDLMDVGRISAGKIVLQSRPVRLGEALDRSVESVRASLEQRRHALALTKLPDDVWVLGDLERLTQVFTNLLSNAVKYTPAGGRIDVEHEVDAERVLVRVRDSGIGIPRAQLDQVFSMFSQVRAHQPRAEGGLGIGLALVRQFVAMHGGSVDVDSDGLDRGSTFTVCLPRLANSPSQDVQPRSVTVATCRLRVLVVDDNVDAAASLAAVLSLDGHETTVVHGGHEAVTCAFESRPDVAILDLGMPGLDGIGVARALRAAPATRAMRLVALTGWGQAADRNLTREAGFDVHLVKPVGLDELRGVLERFAR
jgi:PAS domain S-box-containing protein